MNAYIPDHRMYPVWDREHRRVARGRGERIIEGDLLVLGAGPETRIGSVWRHTHGTLRSAMVRYLDGERENVTLLGALEAADWYVGLFDPDAEALARKQYRALRRGTDAGRFMSTWMIP